jgi:hypothetical protein
LYKLRANDAEVKATVKRILLRLRSQGLIKLVILKVCIVIVPLLVA